MAITILAAATGAGNSSSFAVGSKSHWKVGDVSVVGFGFSTDTADVQVSNDGGTTFADLYINGTKIQLSDTKTQWEPEAAGIYRIEKGITTGTVGFVLSVPESL